MARIYLEYFMLCVIAGTLLKPAEGGHHSEKENDLEGRDSSGSDDGAGLSHHVHYVPLRPKKLKRKNILLNTNRDYKLTQDMDFLHDEKHIREDLGDWAFSPGHKLSNNELEFYHFRMHDSDGNDKLDGLEILQAIAHVIPISQPFPSTKSNQLRSHGKVKNQPFENNASQNSEEDFDYFVELIDEVLMKDDTDSDGFLSYYEFSKAKESARLQLGSLLKGQSPVK